MSEKKNDSRNQTTGNISKEQTTVGFNKTKPSTVNPGKKEHVPNEKVPNIGDPKKKPTHEDGDDKKNIPIKDEPSESRNDDKKGTPEHKEKSEQEQVTNAYEGSIIQLVGL